MIAHEIVHAIEQHTRDILCGRLSPPEGPCPICGERPEGFHRHDQRSRIFLVVVERFVRRIASFVIRWRCSSCGARFTQCPSFALPRKRYVREQILERCARYADEDGATYRSTVRHEGLPVAYEAAVADSIDERTLAPSTPWRWMARLGSLRETCRRAFEMIRARSPRSTLFRHPFVAAAGKYRSDARRAVVESALRLVHAEAAYRTLFGASIFPGLATAAGWM